MPSLFRNSIIAGMLGILLAGCEDAPVEEPSTSVKPVKTVIIGVQEAGGIRNFPGRIDANRKVDLAFRIAGKVSDLPVKEGDQVKKGQIIAKLDPTDINIVIKDRQASFNAASGDYKRASALVGKGHISRRDFDQIESTWKQASAALEQARQDRQYTVLKSPFAGDISKRFIENHEEVEAKQPVVALRDVSVLEVSFSIPQNVMLQLTESASDDEIAVLASFESAPGKQYPLQFKEIATRADPSTQTFEATYTMSAPSDLLVLPGMTAAVSIDLSSYIPTSELTYLPVAAVVSDDKLQSRVWVVNPQSMTVEPRPVTVGEMRGNRIELLSGLESGDRVVIAGVPFLTEGLKVRLLPDVEQAGERSDDPAGDNDQ